MVQKFEFFQVSLLISIRNIFLSNAFSRSEMDIYQILRLNYYKKLKEWWTDDVDGDCISFNLYRDTESSIVLSKRWRGDFREENCLIYLQCFYLEELGQIQWSISKKQNNGRAYETKLEIKNIISITLLNLIQIQNLDLSEYLSIDYPYLKDFRLFKLQFTKKKLIKMYILVISFFTS